MLAARMITAILSCIATQHAIDYSVRVQRAALKNAPTVCANNTMEDLAERKTLEVENRNTCAPKRKLRRKLPKRLLITRLTYNDKR
ncbi:hypothetical protein TETLIM1_000176 [Candidatus Hodgkinia cicadicola]|nr:hypothetical protein TETLIM1_000176 [Candidatus Hodgkinia cicadicola]